MCVCVCVERGIEENNLPKKISRQGFSVDKNLAQPKDRRIFIHFFRKTVQKRFHDKFKRLYRGESQFFQPPSEKTIGVKYREFEKFESFITSKNALVLIFTNK